jgi:hypothetical protein
MKTQHVAPYKAGCSVVAMPQHVMKGNDPQACRYVLHSMHKSDVLMWRLYSDALRCCVHFVCQTDGRTSRERVIGVQRGVSAAVASGLGLLAVGGHFVRYKGSLCCWMHSPVPFLILLLPCLPFVPLHPSRSLPACQRDGMLRAATSHTLLCW